MSLRKSAILKWFKKLDREHSLRNRFPSITHYYRGGLYGKQSGPLEDIFDIKGSSQSNVVEWEGRSYLVEVGNVRKRNIENPMENIFVYAFVTGAEEEIDPRDLVRFIDYHERKVRYKPVNKVLKK